ncbi:receptor-like protein kinase HERK 1 [Brachypodium distachyon]|uniref:Protein kinase domain-containing protein n=1 Tax=Brachypodium distachyon TaxID=15368 RepID=I1H6T3_BRADI|nr:receptor-like protein kinase HERK 1 [Brachypodium distachyon]KQK22263.1 hypothetical protein BRADI_1g66160v3 [Brachypodium distachyon]|eukprot:XP_003558201.1 receptor-like protein kinase HERK 1 [Brachypodium distachyon]
MPPHLDLLLLWLLVVSAPVLASAATPSTAFVPADNYLVICGTSGSATDTAGRTFVGDGRLPASALAAPQSVEANASLSSSNGDEQALYQSARIFTAPASYTFAIKKPGRHFVRLHFFPFRYQSYDLAAAAAFKVFVQGAVFVDGSYTPKNGTVVVKEFSVNVTGGSLVIAFTPTGKLAFVNAIEVVSLPDDLIADTAAMAGSARGLYTGLSARALETVHRINMGAPKITPANDTLWRTWLPDQSFQLDSSLALAEHKEVLPSAIKYTPVATPWTAPVGVYATATKQSTSGGTSTINVQFNVTWRFGAVAAGSDYLLRFHFCDIVSKAATGLAFNVYVGAWLVLDNYEYSRDTINTLAVPVYKDFVLGAKDVKGGNITVSIGSSTVGVSNVSPDGFLNGLEIMRVLGSAGAGAEPSKRSSKVKTWIIAGSAVGGAAVAMALAFIAFRMLCRKRGKPEKKASNSTLSPFSASALGSRSRSSGKKSNGNTIVLGQNGLGAGYRIPLAVLQEATSGFGEAMVIGEGGFGKVYKGTLPDETPVAVKRGSRKTLQAMQEFRTEIEMLSRMRHRHLVSLIGYCDARDEMILVYEYMAMGTLRSHLYGADDLPPLTWEQRLEACIGAARGLHYLHTSSATAVIHRDVKSSNILLDETLMAKVADFGLSKAGPELDKTHVSTKVKGSFGYLDPEYFRRQMLTEKSDVYSFGVVLLEVLCARAVIDPTLPREMVNLAEWAMQWLKKGEVDRIVDQRIAGTIRPQSLKKLADTAEKCLAEYGVERPTMGDVLWCLEFALQLQVASPDDSVIDGMPLAPVATPQVQRIQSIASVATDTAMTANLGDLDGMSMSGVFSKMVKSEEVR